mmetsp:Transcript_83639/g.255588  ORF Transcript_83639/g.255588 Transcript_83639/m.255588 type:complete len:333 (-) Transcript_83639:681-1679(-)
MRHRRGAPVEPRLVAFQQRRSCPGLHLEGVARPDGRSAGARRPEVAAARHGDGGVRHGLRAAVGGPDRRRRHLPPSRRGHGPGVRQRLPRGHARPRLLRVLGRRVRGCGDGPGAELCRRRPPIGLERHESAVDPRRQLVDLGDLRRRLLSGGAGGALRAHAAAGPHTGLPRGARLVRRPGAREHRERGQHVVVLVDPAECFRRVVGIRRVARGAGRRDRLPALHLVDHHAAWPMPDLLGGFRLGDRGRPLHRRDPDGGGRVLAPQQRVRVCGERHQPAGRRGQTRLPLGRAVAVALARRPGGKFGHPCVQLDAERHDGDVVGPQHAGTLRQE